MLATPVIASHISWRCMCVWKGKKHQQNGYNGFAYARILLKRKASELNLPEYRKDDTHLKFHRVRSAEENFWEISVYDTFFSSHLTVMTLSLGSMEKFLDPNLSTLVTNTAIKIWDLNDVTLSEWTIFYTIFTAKSLILKCVEKGAILSPMTFYPTFPIYHKPWLAFTCETINKSGKRTLDV